MALGVRMSRFKFVETDIDELWEQMPKSRECVKLQPTSKTGKISMENLQFSAGSFDIWRMDCGTGLEAKFEAPPDSYVIFLPLSGAMEVRCRGTDLVSRPGTILVGELQQTEFTRKHVGRSHIGLTFSRNAVRQELSEMLDAPVLHDIDLAMEINMGTVAYGYLTSLGHLLWSSFADGSVGPVPMRSTEHLFRTILVSTLEQLPHRYSEALAKPVAAALPRQVKRAIDYMIANIDSPLELADIARAAGVSARSLHAAFQRFKDTTPSNYLRQLRLQSVRRDLLSSTDTVSAVARRWGFVHMGRFSALYRAAFGELPSDTVAKRRESIGDPGSE